MKTTVSQYDFTDAFKGGNYENNFSYEGLLALFDYFEEYEEDCATEIELDVVAIACEFTEYENIAEFQDNYDADDYPDMEAIRDYTTMIDIPDSDRFIIQDF